MICFEEGNITLHRIGPNRDKGVTISVYYSVPLLIYGKPDLPCETLSYCHKELVPPTAGTQFETT